MVFATPGMLHAGLSLQLFRLWASDPKNLCIIAGYCVEGTVGNQVICGQKQVGLVCVAADKHRLHINFCLDAGS